MEGNEIKNYIEGKEVKNYIEGDKKLYWRRRDRKIILVLIRENKREKWKKFI